MVILSRKQKGFTIVELLLVISVIGTLVAISGMYYGKWRQNTAKNEVKSDLIGAMSAMENTRNFGTGYPLAVPTSFQESANVDLLYLSGSATIYCLRATSSVDSTVVFYVNPPTVTVPTATACT